MSAPMKIYTRQGDDGSTGLFGGSRVSKSDPRLTCTGDLDELNAALGVAAVVADTQSLPLIQQVQNDLFSIGSHLATPDPGKVGSLPPVNEAMISRLEQQIDQAESQLTPLKNFILPGGSEPAARLHLARTICRRAERHLVEFSKANAFEPILLKYVNRLSDWLFVHARLANHRAGTADVLWKHD